MSSNNYVAIMAGGIGSRLWPKSRTAKPKQFIDLLNTGKTLIQSTFDRFKSFVPVENIYVVATDEYEKIIREQLPELPKENIVSEPSRKNTAPCIAYISFKLLQKNPDANLIVAPSDHLIMNEEEFKSITAQALDFSARLKALVTLGIKPTYPNTGYGYIQHEPMQVASNIFKVKTFTEKPNLEIAKAFLESGDFLWNAGIFIWTAQSILKSLQQFQSEMYEAFDAEKDAFNTPVEKEAVEKIYSLCTSISIDMAVMEHAKNVYVIPSSFGWSDLGSWNNTYENLEKDYLGNAVAGNNVMIIDATKCMISAPQKKLVVLQGLDDCIVIETDDVLLVCKKDKEQEIKEYVAEVKRNFSENYI
ncbi:MAG: mannose-1-phosphate guanylyltransferase [Chitinophagaceae bacterium]|jgi:mannose-1-phosphate guanylyltransferase|nr:mannose-1-phosphate guanylyltransferase [Chitinophagaceae bacterium]